MKYWKQTKCQCIEEWLNKLWYSHMIDCYATIKKNREDLYELIWNESQDKLLSKKGKAQKMYLRHVALHERKKRM